MSASVMSVTKCPQFSGITNNGKNTSEIDGIFYHPYADNKINCKYNIFLRSKAHPALCELLQTVINTIRRVRGIFILFILHVIPAGN